MLALQGVRHKQGNVPVQRRPPELTHGPGRQIARASLSTGGQKEKFPLCSSVGKDDAALWGQDATVSRTPTGVLHSRSPSMGSKRLRNYRTPCSPHIVRRANSLFRTPKDSSPVATVEFENKNRRNNLKYESSRRTLSMLAYITTNRTCPVW